MEVFYYYKGYGVRYMTIGGTTVVEENGFEIERFVGLGEAKGKKEAEKFIDELED